MRLPANHYHKTISSLRTPSQVCTPRPVLGGPGFAGLSLPCHPLPSQNRKARSRKPAVVTPTSALAAVGATHLPPMLQSFLSPATLALTVLSAIAISAWASVRRKSSLSQITADPTGFNKGVLSRCPTINSHTDYSHCSQMVMWRPSLRLKADKVHLSHMKESPSPVQMGVLCT